MASLTHVFGIFGASQQAELAVDGLINAGFEAWAITVMLPDNESSRNFAQRKNTRPPQGTDRGKSADVPLGGTLGWADPWAGPIGGALEGALAEMGVAAEWSHGRVLQGKLLLSVECANPQSAIRATEILRRTGAEDTNSFVPPKTGAHGYADTEGYRALRESAALISLRDHGRIVVRGQDRARLIHALTTTHIQEMQPGQGKYCFFLTAQGRILADANVLCFSNHLLIDTEPETRERLLQHIEHYLIADEVELEYATQKTFALALEGPEAGAFLRRAGVPAPEKAGAHLNWDGITVARLSSTGAEGFRFYGPAERGNEAREKLFATGAILANAEDTRTVRIEHMVPRYGEDITGTTLAQETGIRRALHFQKGCYLGQEIVERIRSRTHVNRVLAGLEGAAVPSAGAKVLSGGAKVGKVTSSAWSRGQGKAVAIAMLQVAQSVAGTQVEIDGMLATVRGPISG